MYPSDGPDCHACGAAPQFQWTRRATAEEAAVQKREIAELQGRVLTDAEIAERYGPLRVAVTGCVVHYLAPEPADDSDEAAAQAAQAGVERRALLHEADCGGHGVCACEGQWVP